MAAPKKTGINEEQEQELAEAFSRGTGATS